MQQRTNTSTAPSNSNSHQQSSLTLQNSLKNNLNDELRKCSIWVKDYKIIDTEYGLQIQLNFNNHLALQQYLFSKNINFSLLQNQTSLGLHPSVTQTILNCFQNQMDTFLKNIHVNDSNQF